MLKAVLFDIDNTLIYFDETEFFKSYMKEIIRAFADVIPPDQFQEKIMTASQALLHNDGSICNADYFIQRFTQDMDVNRDEIWNKFIRFYETHFSRFESIVEAAESAPEVLQSVKDAGLKSVAASNPFWPDIVQRMRLEWADLNSDHFDLITHIENMSHCKPQTEYYLQISDMLQVSPQECLMVGNDRVNDMVAGKVEMKTYLIRRDHGRQFDSLSMSRSLRKEKHVEEVEPHFEGDLAGVIPVMMQLME